METEHIKAQNVNLYLNSIPDPGHAQIGKRFQDRSKNYPGVY